MDKAIAFTVSLDDMMDTQRLALRKYALGASMVILLVGLGLAAVDRVAGVVVVGLGVVAFLSWRFPIIDRWLIRRRAGCTNRSPLRGLAR